MKELINVSILLCKEFDEDAANITQLFDAIKIKEGEDTSFSIVTVLNTVEYTKSKFALYYFMINLDKRKQLYIGNDIFERENEEENVDSLGENQKYSLSSDSSQKVSVINIEKISFLSGGDHEIQVYLYEEDEVDVAENMVSNKQYSLLRKKGKLVSTYSLSVEK